jgi:hypothetical protein
MPLSKIPPWPGLNSIHEITVPRGILLKGIAFPISGDASSPETTVCPTCNPFCCIKSKSKRSNY